MKSHCLSQNVTGPHIVKKYAAAEVPVTLQGTGLTEATSCRTSYVAYVCTNYKVAIIKRYFESSYLSAINIKSEAPFTLHKFSIVICRILHGFITYYEKYNICINENSSSLLSELYGNIGSGQWD